MKRPMIVIDEEKCTGCGECVTACAEGALVIIDGKARVVREEFCDGLGACLGECPEGALTIEQREAPAFDEEAVKRHLAARDAPLKQWPIQLMLLSPLSPFLRNADFVLAADCAGFAQAGFHDVVAGRPFAIACPKLDNPEPSINRLADIFRAARPKRVTVLRMEVPCCGGLQMMVKMAMDRAGVSIPVESEVIEIGPAFGGRGGGAPTGGGCPSSRGGFLG